MSTFASENPVITIGLSKAIDSKSIKIAKALLDPGLQYEFETYLKLTGRIELGDGTTRAPSGSPDLIIAQAIAHSGAMADYLLAKYKESLNTEAATLAALRKQYASELATIKGIKALAPPVPVSGRIKSLVSFDLGKVW